MTHEWVFYPLLVLYTSICFAGKRLVVNLLKLSWYRTSFDNTLKTRIKAITQVLIIVFVFLLFYIMELHVHIENNPIGLLIIFLYVRNYFFYDIVKSLCSGRVEYKVL